MHEPTTEAPVSLGAFQAMAWFFANSLDVFLAVDGDVLRKTNPVWTRRTGWEAAETEGRPFWEFVHADDVESARAAWGALGAREQGECEFRVRAKSGEWLSMEASAVRGAAGWTLAILRDVTADRLRERDREEAHRVAGMLQTTAGVTVWRYSGDTDQYEINPDFTRSTSAIAAERHETGEDVRATIHRADAPALYAAWSRTLATGEPGLMNYRERTARGRWRHMQVAWQGVRRLASGRWEILGIARDVTELTTARDAALEGERAALAAAEAKSQFLANISHEIRTPMNGVLGVLHLIEAGPPAAERKRLVREALAAGVGLSDLLNDIIDYSDIETGRIELAREPIDPVEQLGSVIALFKGRAAKKGLQLNVSSAPDIGFVSADPKRLRKMFFHLIGNAVKFTHLGSIDVRLAHSGVGEARRLRLEVKDTGVGIPLAAQAGLFERFKQADGSSTRRFGGQGLGLSITRRLAQLMDGSVGFNSREGAGSTFWIDIGAPSCSPAADDKEPPAGWLAGLRVLVVEDNLTNRLVATRMLSILGAEVDTAEDGAEGVAAVERSHYDLVFMDIQMPVMDGVEATRRIRAMPKPKCAVPIVATTANVMSEQLAAYRACGISGVVAKPISPATLLAEVSRIANDVGRDVGGELAQSA